MAIFSAFYTFKPKAYISDLLLIHITMLIKKKRHLTWILLKVPYVVWASLVAQLVKKLPAMWETWVGKIPGEGKGYSLQYSGLGNSMACIVHGVTKSWTTEQLSLSLCARQSTQQVFLKEELNNGHQCSPSCPAGKHAHQNARARITLDWCSHILAQLRKLRPGQGKAW